MSRILSVSVPDALVEEVEAVAAAQGRTKSDFVRDAVRRQLQLERFREVQRYARAEAERRGLGPEDVEPLIDELRVERV